MKIRVNTEIIRLLNPCKDRFDNWIKHYGEFDGDILKFLDLPDISSKDKIWVTCRIIPRFFAIDCAVTAAADAADAYAADAAAYAAAYAADYAADYAAAYAADYAAASKEQLEVLKYLIENHKE